MNLTDTHCHLNFEKFNLDRGDVIERAWSVGLTRILIPATDIQSSAAILELVKTDTRIFAAVGFHPTDYPAWNDASLEQLRQIILNSDEFSPERSGARKMVAIGEIGLDYYWDDSHHELQQQILENQLRLAAEFELPVILHMREKSDAMHGNCAEDLLTLLAAWVQTLKDNRNPLASNPGVLHSFSGNLDTAQKLINMNFRLGITGPLTFKNAEARREVVKSIPLERMLIETDSPFLAPVPKRGTRNEPAFVGYIVEKIAEILNRNPEEIAAATTSNASKLFSWGG